jgi:hypothetical protein
MEAAEYDQVVAVVVLEQQPDITRLHWRKLEVLKAVRRLHRPREGSGEGTIGGISG